MGAVYRDSKGVNCIKISQSAHTVTYTVLLQGQPVKMHTTTIDSFHQRYVPLNDFPVGKMCKLFQNYFRLVGATEEVKECIEQILQG